MYWSWVQSTGADMRKYLTASWGQAAEPWMWKDGSGLTVVDLLQGDDGVGGQALLGVLVEQKGLGSHRPLLRRWHCRVLVTGVHEVTRRSSEDEAEAEAQRMERCDVADVKLGEEGERAR